MQVIRFFLGNSLRNFNYIVKSDFSHDCLIFDPYCIERTQEVCERESLNPLYLLNTHKHPDHIRANKKVIRKYPALKHLKLADGENLMLSDTERVECRHTPGHVKDHYCFFLYEKDSLMGIIVGDTVFNAGIGNCKSFSGNKKQLFKTIRDVFNPLTDDVKIYPSHDYYLSNLKFSKSIEPDNKEVQKRIAQRESQQIDQEFVTTTIGEEREINPFFRVFNKDYVKKLNAKNEEELFIQLRSLRDRW